MEDFGIVDPRCISKYNNQNCSSAQKQSGITEYRSIRLKQLQEILQNTTANSQPKASNKAATKAAETKATSKTTKSKSLQQPASSSVTKQSFNASSVSLVQPMTGYSTCDRAFRLLGVADLFARYNATCQVRIFGISANPDFWIRKCDEAIIKPKNY